MAPAVYLMAIAILGLAGALLLPETSKIELSAAGTSPGRDALVKPALGAGPA